MGGANDNLGTGMSYTNITTGVTFFGKFTSEEFVKFSAEDTVCDKLSLFGGLAVRRACYGVLRFVMESGAKGCEVVVSGKLRAARAKSMKFTDGFMIHSGQPARDFVDYAVRHVLLRQGVLGIKVKIMKGWDPEGQTGPRKPLPDSVQILEPPVDKIVSEPSSEQKEPITIPVAAPVAEESAYAPAQDGYQEPYGEQGTF